MTTDSVSDADKARAELTATLDAIQEKLDVPKQAKLATERAGRRVQELRTENPVAFGAAVVGVAALVGGVVWLIVRAFRK
jgi:hypothetical protein